jgi:carbon monoxide dehydrogenase subunit G
MKLENEFTVAAPVEQAWEVMLDMERVAPCLPGAAIESSSSDGSEHVGTMAIKLGPITARYRGTVRVLEADVERRRAVMRAQASEQRGQGTAAATITSTMSAVPDGTRVRVETEMQVTGPAAQFGRGVMQDVSAKLMRRFAEHLAEEIGAGQAHVAAGGDGAARAEAVATGTAGIKLPPGPAAAAAEAAARARASAAAPPRRRAAEEVLDLGAVGRAAVLERALPVAAVLAALAALVALVRRRAR